MTIVDENQRMMRECYKCRHRRSIPGDTHILCSMPDMDMEGNPHVIRNGWFAYPFSFDPVWKEKLCKNFEKS